MSHTHYTPPPPEPTTLGPRYPALPDPFYGELAAALNVLSQRQAARLSRLSSITRLRGGR